MRKQPLSLTADPAIRATFQAQLAEARETPGLSRMVRRPAPDLYPRYSDYYRQLSQLPRRVRRALQRQWKRSLSALALLLALGQAPALRQTSTSMGPTVPWPTLSAQLIPTPPVGGCTKGNGADRLMLAPKSTHTLTTVEDTTYGDTGLPLVTSTITIVGRKSTIERGAGAPALSAARRLPRWEAHARKAYPAGRVAHGGYPTNYNGGGILNYGGSLILTDCNVSGNTAIFGGGVFIARWRRVKFEATLTLKQHRLGQYGPRWWRGVSNYGTLILTNSTVSGNKAGRGGGVFTTTSGPSPSPIAPCRGIQATTSAAACLTRGTEHPHEQHDFG